MSSQANKVEIALLEKRLAEVFAHISGLRISLAETTKSAIDENWTELDHDEARREPLAELEQLRLEIHRLTDRLATLRDS